MVHGNAQRPGFLECHALEQVGHGAVEVTELAEVGLVLVSGAVGLQELAEVAQLLLKEGSAGGGLATTHCFYIEMAKVPEDERTSEVDNSGDPETISEFAGRIKVPFSMSIASKRNTGKTLLVSVLIRELLELKAVDMVLVMSQTQHVNDDYKFLPARLRQSFSEEVIKKLLETQGKVPKKERDQVLLVLDDVLSDREAEKSRFIKRLYTLGRHYDISIVLISQTSNVALTPAIKQNSDWLLYSRQNRYMLESIWSTVCNIDKKTFIAWSEENNKNYTFLAVDNTSQSNNPAEFLIKVKVTPEEAAKINPDTSSEEDEQPSRQGHAQREQSAFRYHGPWEE